MVEGADRNEIVKWFIKNLSDQLSQVFDTMAGESPLIEAESPGAAPSGTDGISWEIAFNAVPGAPLWIHCSRPGWHNLGNRVLVAAGLEDSDDQMIQDTFKEAMDQALSGLAREMTGRLGREVNAGPARLATAALPSGLGWNRLELIFGDNVGAPINFGFPDQFIEALLPKAADSAAKAAAAGNALSIPTAADTARPHESRTLDLLLDVELPISVSFGRAHLPLKDVMKLTTGSIVELNRTISEPVDIIVNNCVIARGEVVVVEGNFGVRIQEVISRQERLRTLY